MSEPRAWEIGSPDGAGSFVTEGAVIAQCARANGWPVTPLVAAPPEGAPAYNEMTRLLHGCFALFDNAGRGAFDNGVVHDGMDEGAALAYRLLDDLRAMLSRLPKDAPDTEQLK